MRKSLGWILLFCLLISLTSCGQPDSNQRIKKVGLLVPESIDDQVWGTKGYRGLLKIQSTYDVDVFYKEDTDSATATGKAVAEFVDKGVNIIFGHGSEYSPFFHDLARKYPDVTFICFNGDARGSGSNMTSINFDSNAMGFFGGMVAGEMTKTNKIGVIAAFEWQPEVNGFYEGASYQNDDVDIEIRFVQHWDDEVKALSILNQMIENGVDVVYPAGDGFNVPVIEKLKENGLYAIGYVSDQSDLGTETVLTSTVQHVDQLYALVADLFNKGELKSGNLYFDFEDDVVSMGKFSPNVDKDFRQKLEGYIQTYIENGELPNQ